MLVKKATKAASKKTEPDPDPETQAAVEIAEKAIEDEQQQKRPPAKLAKGLSRRDAPQSATSPLLSRKPSA
jgi:hypothetical protein